MGTMLLLALLLELYGAALFLGTLLLMLALCLA